MARLLIEVDAGKQQHHAAAYDSGSDRIVGRLKFAVSQPEEEVRAIWRGALSNPFRLQPLFVTRQPFLVEVHLLSKHLYHALRISQPGLITPPDPQPS